MKRGPLSFLLFLFPVCFSCRSDYNHSLTTGDSFTGTSLYINSIDGNDNYPGTRRKPIKTVDEANKRIQAEHLALFFSGGQTFGGTLQVNNISGTEKEPVIIDSYGRGKAIIDGGKGEAIRVEGCRRMIVRNMNIMGDGRKNGNTSNGLAIISSRDCLFENISAEGFQKSGIDLYNCRDIKVRRIYSHDNGFCGINIMGSEKHMSGNILVQSCKTENNPGDPTILDNHSGNGILAGVSDSVIIEYCTATNNGWDMPRLGNGPVGIWAWMSDHVTIRYCISYRNKTSKGAKDGGASDWSDNKIRYCVSINDAQTTEGSGSFFIWNGSNESSQLTNCSIRNNIIYNSSAPAISFENASLHENFIFSQNLFIGSGDLIAGKNTGSIYKRNLWIGKKGESQMN